MTAATQRVGAVVRRPRLGSRARTWTTRPPYLVLVVLSLMVLVLGIAVFALRANLSYLNAVDAAREQAVAVAPKHAQDILSYDYRTISDDVARAKATTTGTFRTEYAKHAEEVLLPTAKEQQITVTAMVRGASVVEAEPDRVVTLLFVNQSRVREGEEETKIDQNRVRMTLTRAGDRWLVSKLEAL